MEEILKDEGVIAPDEEDEDEDEENVAEQEDEEHEIDLQLVEEGEDESLKESDEENAIGTIAVRTSTTIFFFILELI